MVELKIERVAMECTGTYGKSLRAILDNAGFTIWVVRDTDGVSARAMVSAVIVGQRAEPLPGMTAGKFKQRHEERSLVQSGMSLGRGVRQRRTAPIRTAARRAG